MQNINAFMLYKPLQIKYWRIAQKDSRRGFWWLGGLFFFPQEHISYFKKLLYFPDLKFETRLEFWLKVMWKENVQLDNALLMFFLRV